MKKTLLVLAFICFVISLKAETTTNIDTADKSKQVFTTVEHPPEFPGGEVAFGHFLAANIKYPEIDKRKNVQGKVFVQFIVESDGSLSNMKILHSPSQSIADETIRVLQLSPNWTPGIQDGRNVRVQYIVPINFSLGK